MHYSKVNGFLENSILTSIENLRVYNNNIKAPQLFNGCSPEITKGLLWLLAHLSSLREETKLRFIKNIDVYWQFSVFDLRNVTDIGENIK